MADPIPTEQPTPEKIPVEDELANIKRRLESLQKTLDLLYQDRNMMEDIVSRLQMVENALHLNKEHQTEVQQDIKQEINSVKDSIGEKTVILKGTSRNYLSELWEGIKGKLK